MQVPIPVPLPEIRSPLPGTPPADPDSDEIGRTSPFLSSTEDLAAYGYVEEEFLIS
ncbi:hypothetical protein [Streptomonospora wellingtoniae]|uniref:Uncharacterized protein n=1 Tax=Streptomonospora wellingtoniae TaxID=3075544 RepID=A0ABU2KNL0_9ACTN|nr:hypothetical protein [Streptomonospora sp. DSM 45055]MDT0300856.1 hypothetical protein [Streptomonospora sp. DSM 45055]